LRSGDLSADFYRYRRFRLSGGNILRNMTFMLNGAATLEPIASHIWNQNEKPFVRSDHPNVNVAEPAITKTGAASMNDAQEASAPDVMADAVIVGTGPAGASLACFLASYGKNSFG
jgi:hypothetical protein